jgi:hypothetical protein
MNSLSYYRIFILTSWCMLSDILLLWPRMASAQAPELNPNVLSLIDVDGQTFKDATLSLLGMVPRRMEQGSFVNYAKSKHHDVKLVRRR